MARGVTQMRLRGSDISTSVQAERQGPSMTTRSPDARTVSNSSQERTDLPAGTCQDAHLGRGGHGERRDDAANSTRRRTDRTARIRI